MQGRRSLFNLSIPTEISYAAKPLSPDVIVENIPLNNFLKKAKMTAWTNDIFYSETCNEPIQAANWDELTDNEVSELLSTIEKIEKHLVICDMGTCGFGVFTSETIPAGSYISIYAGEILPQSKTTSAYGFAIKTKANMIVGMMDPVETGGTSRFYQHASASLNDYTFSVDKNQVCVANMVPSFKSYKNCPFILFRSRQEIKKYEGLYFDYGDLYEFSELCFFTKDGNVLPKSKYKLVPNEHDFVDDGECDANTIGINDNLRALGVFV